MKIEIKIEMDQSCCLIIQKYLEDEEAGILQETMRLCRPTAKLFNWNTFSDKKEVLFIASAIGIERQVRTPCIDSILSKIIFEELKEALITQADENVINLEIQNIKDLSIRTIKESLGGFA